MSTSNIKDILDIKKIFNYVKLSTLLVTVSGFGYLLQYTTSKNIPFPLTLGELPVVSLVIVVFSVLLVCLTFGLFTLPTISKSFLDLIFDYEKRISRYLFFLFVVPIFSIIVTLVVYLLWVRNNSVVHLDDSSWYNTLVIMFVIFIGYISVLVLAKYYSTTKDMTVLLNTKFLFNHALYLFMSLLWAFLMLVLFFSLMPEDIKQLQYWDVMPFFVISVVLLYVIYMFFQLKNI